MVGIISFYEDLVPLARQRCVDVAAPYKFYDESPICTASQLKNNGATEKPHRL